MYYVYMNLSMTALEVFNCGVQELEDPITGEVVSDGKQYMSETNWVCYEKGGDHIALVPLAVIAICVYTIGYPCYMAYVLFTPKNKARAITMDFVHSAAGLFRFALSFDLASAVKTPPG